MMGSNITETKKDALPSILLAGDDDNDNADDYTDVHTDDNKSHTFRKRRLIYTKHQMETADPSEMAGPLQNDSDVDEPPLESSDQAQKSHTFRKRRLTYTKHHLEDAAAAATAALMYDDDDEDIESKEQDEASLLPPRKRSRRDDEQCKTLQSRVVHAGELMRHPPTSITPENRLYHPPFRIEPIQTEEDRATIPEWKHRHTHHDGDEKLPFPRNVVGTFSCHGVEPLYDSDYEHLPDEDEEDTDADDWFTEAVGEKAVDDLKVKGKDQPAEDSSGEKGKESKETKLTTMAKINQDRGGVAFPYGNCARTALFAAYDGHGQGGELVSQFALHEVQRRLEKHSHFNDNVEKAFVETFLSVDKDLTKEPLIEPKYAGTTACVVLLRENVLTTSNVGDSRAVLARRKQGVNGDPLTAWETINLSKDQNPDVPEEQERIEKHGGFVSPPPEPGLSARVWLDSTYSQIGLAMARSIGDHAVKPVGVIAEPVVTRHDITEEDDFLIIATDGVWEFITSEEAVRIVSENISSGASKACQALIETAASKWHDEEGNYRDDITALVICLQKLWGSDEGTTM